MASSLPKLSGMGFKPGEDGLFDSALAVIGKKGYTYINITPSFVLELSSLVEVKQNGEPTSSSTLSVGQFTQILLFMIARTSCFSSTKEASYLKRVLYDKRHFTMLTRGVEEGKVHGEGVWTKVTALITAGKVKAACTDNQLEESGGAGSH